MHWLDVSLDDQRRQVQLKIILNPRAYAAVFPAQIPVEQHFDCML
jgi:hypothetical protein